MAPWLENLLMYASETLIAVLPARRPSAEQLAAATIVAHRGERDGVDTQENTVAAFDACLAAGVGAIEFDIRYTRDDEPVVHHDRDLARVWGISQAVSDLSWAELQAIAPEVPHAADLIARYAGRCTLMIELKTRASARAEARLHAALAGLTPGRDYYWLSLDPALFAVCAQAPAAAKVIVAKTNWSEIRDWALDTPCGGLAGPFLFIRRRDVTALAARGAWVGSGFLTRRGLLLREIERDIPWLFTDQPVRLQRMLDQARKRRG